MRWEHRAVRVWVWCRLCDVWDWLFHKPGEPLRPASVEKLKRDVPGAAPFQRFEAPPQSPDDSQEVVMRVMDDWSKPEEASDE